MSKAGIQSKDNTLATVGRLVEMSKLDTLYKDLYLQRARTLLGPIFSRGSYFKLKENRAQIPWTEQQLRASIERNDWKRANDLTERLKQLRASLESGSDAAKLAETVYENASTVAIDQFSSGLNVFVGAESETLQAARVEAVDVLLALERSDAERKDFYSRRIADFKQLSIVSIDNLEKTKDARVDKAQLQQAALSALDSGDLSKLDQMIAAFAKTSDSKEEKQETAGAKSTEAVQLGDDLLYTFSQETLAAARELGLAPIRTESRRHFAHLVPHGWQPSFRKDEIRKWSKDNISRLSFPSETKDNAREAIEFFLLNPFINSGGIRYHVCLVAEDLLLENFPEPDPNQETPSKLLDMLKLSSRWGLSRNEIEEALLEHGAEVLQKLQLDPELFRLVAIPADLFTHLGPQLAWGQKEMWTHYDGYRVLEGGKLQALAGGDKRFGGTHDVVSFSPDYSSSKILVRFAVVQRKRMKDWHK